MPELSDNKRIAKNTLLLYLRMFYSLLISLFTARVILQALGFTDYGLYNVVGSVTTMFMFLRSAMGNATNRYIAFGVGKGDIEGLKKTFSTCVIVHAIIAIAIIILCEVVGLWLFHNKMEIPPERMNACFWVLQFSIATCAMGVICVPYDADIIAHEKMGAFAFISILDTTLRLGVVYAVKYFPQDKLIFYAFLLFAIQVMNRIIYGAYCTKHFPESHFSRIVDKPQIKEMFTFAFWNLFGNMSAIACTPILNIFLNMFFGPVVNAARGIAVQVQSVVQGFISNFQLAVIPQITKTYAAGNLQRMNNLIITSSKFSYFLFLFMALPLILEAEQVLTLWLGDIPDHTISFMRITMLIMLISSWIQPLHTANLATGKIRKFQTLRGIVMIMMLPISYIALLAGSESEIVFVVQLVVTFAAQIVMLFVIRPIINISLRKYFVEVFFRAGIVSVLSAIAPYITYKLLPQNIWTLLLVCFVSVISVATFVYFLGLNKSEKAMVNEKLNPLLIKFHILK